MNNFINQTKSSMGAKVTIKLIVILVLILIMLIPQAMIKDTVRERQYREEEIARNIASQVGGNVDVAGPILAIPYLREQQTISLDKNKKEIINSEFIKEMAFFNPKSLDILSDVAVTNKKKSIYKIPYFQSKNTLVGSYNQPNFDYWTDEEFNKINWEEAFLIVQINDLKSIQENPILQWNGANINFQPGDNGAHLGLSSIHAKLPENWRDNLNFEISINLRGTQALNFASSAQSNALEMKSNWPDPNFESTQNASSYSTNTKEGSYRSYERNSTLPTAYEIFKDKSGFDAQWNESQFSAAQIPQWLSTSVTPNFFQRLMGAEFANPSNNYSKVSRSVKYMAMIIALVFTVFFIIELLRANRVHPFQYTLIGSAIAVFFLLLLALSEYMSFGLSYLMAAIATIGLIGLYSVSVFKNKQLASQVSLILSALFAFIFVILNATEYSLIVGAIGLFFILATIMYVTRNIKWYNSSES